MMLNYFAIIHSSIKNREKRQIICNLRIDRVVSAVFLCFYPPIPLIRYDLYPIYSVILCSRWSLCLATAMHSAQGG